MKTPLTIFALVFTVMFSTASFGDWTKIGESASGNTFHIDFERIRTVDGYVYFWILTDFLKPNRFGTFSIKVYHQADCKNFRILNLSFSFYKEPMGGGVGDIDNPTEVDWVYPNPKSPNESILKLVCSR